MELWHVPIYVHPYEFGRAYLGRMDVAGDSTEELVLVEISEDWRGVDPTTAGAVSVSLIQKVSVLRPNDGVPIWSATFPGRFVLGGSIRFLAFVAAAYGVLDDVDVLSDTDRDGRPDILTGHLDWAGISVAVYAAHYSTVVRSGPSGTEIARRDWPGYPAVSPSDDLSGDGSPDLVVVDEAPGGYAVSAHPIRPGPPHWIRNVSDAGRYPSPSVVRLTGASEPDVLVRSYYAPPAFGDALTALRGTDGRVLWSRVEDARDDRMEAIGDVDGDGGSDLAYVATSLAPRWWEPALIVEAYSGASGRRIWGPLYLDESGDFPYPHIQIADLTGDGRADVLAQRLVREAGVVLFPTHLIDGKTGVELRKTVETSLLLQVAADVNGNGTQDLRAGYRLLEGSTGELLWTIDRTGAGDHPIGSFGAPVNDAPGDEIVLWLQEFHPEDETYTHAVEVHSRGALLWREDGV